ncbi:hypothetical protein [Rubricoccus marinus]|uniref:DUF5117 domain-containing protein n=1 Tax=Rubricoccus marinus TaxID=716817 RepID=A0A259TW73_9BACT|nr:hypothetical protein [Rubricoccus marinus]OZC01971.1 hypothetical protein BSZ36_02630 [Rubricoccus marinus]
MTALARSSALALLLLASGASAQQAATPEGPAPEARPPMGLLAGRELMAEMLDALGGVAAWDSVEAYSTAGDTQVNSLVMGDVSVESISVVRGADGVRVEQFTPVGSVLVQIDGDRVGFAISGESRPAPDGMASSVRSQLLFSVPYVIMRREDLAINRVADRPGGLPVLRFRAPGVEALYDLVMSQDRRPLRIESIQASAAGPGYYAYIFSDYREADGLLVPFQTEQRVDDLLLTTTVLSAFTVSPEITARTFAR